MKFFFAWDGEAGDTDPGENPTGPGPSPFLCRIASSSMDLSWDVESLDLECNSLRARTKTGSNSTAVITTSPVKKAILVITFWSTRPPHNHGR